MSAPDAFLGRVFLLRVRQFEKLFREHSKEILHFKKKLWFIISYMASHRQINSCHQLLWS